MVGNLSFIDIFCGVVGLFLITVLIFGGTGTAYGHLFSTPLEVYYGNVSADVPQDLEYFQIPIQYDPNSTIYVTAIKMYSGSDVNDTIKTDENGFAIYTANISDVDTDAIYNFETADTHQVQSFIFHKSKYTDDCTVHDRTGGKIEDLNEEIHHYDVSPILNESLI